MNYDSIKRLVNEHFFNLNIKWVQSSIFCNSCKNCDYNCDCCGLECVETVKFITLTDVMFNEYYFVEDKYSGLLIRVTSNDFNKWSKGG